MFRGKVLNKIIAAVLVAAINISPVQAAVNSNNELRANYITNNEGEIITYEKASDFWDYDLYEHFIYNSNCDKEVLFIREGLSIKDFVRILICNAPTYLVEQQYTFKAQRNSDGTVSVYTDRLYEGDENRIVDEKYRSIKNEILTEGMTEYEETKAIYDYVYENISYSKESRASVYDVLINGEAANSDAIAAIIGGLLSRASIVHDTVAGVRGYTYHYMVFCCPENSNGRVSSQGYLIDAAKDIANGTKYEHFLVSGKNIDYSFGAAVMSIYDIAMEDYEY